MKITGVEAVPLRAMVDADAADNMGETAIIIVSTDEGVTGFGEANVSPTAVQAFITQPEYWIWSRGVSGLLLGADPRDPAKLWDSVYAANWWSARNGIGHIALAGVDMALWDIAGKAADKPVWELLGEKRHDPIMPYITMYEGPSPFPETLRSTIAAIDVIKAQGFTAAKVEAANHRTASDDETVELVRLCRERAGSDLELLCDFCYRWTNAEDAFKCIQRLEEFDLFLFEAPLVPDNVDEYRKLAELVRTPIAGAEILTSYAEFAMLMDAGGVEIVQPCVARVGITEMHRLARYAAAKGRRLIPYGWVATALSAAATLHVAAVNDNVPFVEYAPPAFYPDAGLRRDVAGPEPALRDGAFEVPAGPGLGISIDRDALEEFAHQKLDGK